MRMNPELFTLRENKGAIDHEFYVEWKWIKNSSHWAKKKGGWEMRGLEQRNAINPKLKPPVLKQIDWQKYKYVRLALYSLCFQSTWGFGMCV